MCVKHIMCRQNTFAYIYFSAAANVEMIRGKYGVKIQLSQDCCRIDPIILLFPPHSIQNLCMHTCNVNVDVP